MLIDPWPNRLTISLTEAASICPYSSRTLERHAKAGRFAISRPDNGTRKRPMHIVKQSFLEWLNDDGKPVADTAADSAPTRPIAGRVSMRF